MNQDLHQASTFFTAHPEPFHIIWFAIAFVINFLFCRYMAIKLVTIGYIRKHPIVLAVGKKGKIKEMINTKVTTEEYRKLFYFWFVPVFGAASMIMLYIACAGKQYIINIKQRIFLNHI